MYVYLVRRLFEIASLPTTIYLIANSVVSNRPRSSRAAASAFVFTPIAAPPRHVTSVRQNQHHLQFLAQEMGKDIMQSGCDDDDCSVVLSECSASAH